MFSPHAERWSLTCSAQRDSLQQKKTSQATACLLVQRLPFGPPPSLPYFAPEPMWQILRRSILKSFLVSFWYWPWGRVHHWSRLTFCHPAQPGPHEWRDARRASRADGTWVQPAPRALPAPPKVGVYVPPWASWRREKKKKKKKKQGSKC